MGCPSPAGDIFSTCGEPSKEPSSLKAPACTVSTTRSVFGDTRRLTLALQASSTNLPSTSSTTSEICACLLYTSDAADDLLCVDLGGRRIIKKKKKNKKKQR